MSGQPLVQGLADSAKPEKWAVSLLPTPAVLLASNYNAETWEHRNFILCSHQC